MALARGQAAEDQALRLLKNQGLSLIARNYHARCGELDLVMQHDELLVIVEVRYRKHAAFGSAAESVNQSKQRRIIATTKHFLNHHPEHASRSIRFDVVALQAGQEPQWLQDAFQTT